MVEVAMGVEQFYRGKFILVKKTGQLFPLFIKITAGIYNECMPLFVIHYVCIFLNGAECKSFNSEHGLIFVLLITFFDSVFYNQYNTK
jgi:hypothetical protein